VGKQGTEIEFLRRQICHVEKRKVSMRQLQLVSHGDPSQVVELKTFSEPDLGEDDVRISMEAAPINPSDFLLIRGRYGIRPTLPFGLGAEGSAVLAT
jgi:NADPH:quinone reductase-like Zn-dependent oxidoreductase